MGTILEQMLNGILIIPFQKELTSKLTTLCESYAKTVDRHKVEECASAFLYSKSNVNLSSYIMEQYQEQFGDAIKLPSVVYHILSGYVLHILIVDEDEEFDAADKMQYSLIVRNMMVIHKNSHDQLLAPAFIPLLYPFSDSYRENMSLITEPEDKLITPNIFESESFEDMGITLDESLFDEIRQLAEQAEKLKYQELINEIKSKKTEDPFVLACYAASILAVNPEWRFIDPNPVKTLMSILPANRKSEKLKNIKTKLNDSEWYTTYDTNSESSILLTYINGSANAITEINELKFTDLEFAIYMYYEFFLEELIIN